MSGFTSPFDLPLDGAAAPARIPSVEARDALGVDILFLDDYVVTPDGDYQLVAGLENLRRWILRCLLVSQGEFRVRPSFGAGVAQFVKKPITAARRDELRNRILEQLRRDDRIEQIQEVAIETVTINAKPAVRIRVRVQALGRAVEFQPFSFAREA